MYGLSADDQEITRPEHGACEAVSGLERLEGDTEALGNLFQSVSALDLVPQRGFCRGKLRLCRKRWKLVIGYPFKQLLDFRFEADGNF